MSNAVRTVIAASRTCVDDLIKWKRSRILCQLLKRQHCFERALTAFNSSARMANAPRTAYATSLMAGFNEIMFRTLSLPVFATRPRRGSEEMHRVALTVFGILSDIFEFRIKFISILLGV